MTIHRAGPVYSLVHILFMITASGNASSTVYSNTQKKKSYKRTSRCRLCADDAEMDGGPFPGSLITWPLVPSCKVALSRCATAVLFLEQCSLFEHNEGFDGTWCFVGDARRPLDDVVLLDIADPLFLFQAPDDVPEPDPLTALTFVFDRSSPSLFVAWLLRNSITITNSNSSRKLCLTTHIYLYVKCKMLRC